MARSTRVTARSTYRIWQGRVAPMSRSTRRTVAAEDEEDMQMSASDGEPEVEAEYEDDEMDDEDGDEQEDAEEDDPDVEIPGVGAGPSDVGSSHSSLLLNIQPRLKIKLKLPASTPSVSSQPPSRRSPSRDIESEDDSNAPVQSSGQPSDDDDNELESEDSESAIVAAARGKGSKPMTARQAALANGGGGGSGFVTFDPTLNPYSKKKKYLTDTEIALRREETARKRKNLSEKKLEDEKAETINRLLKKQSRPQAKNKRATGTAIISLTDTPARGSSAGDGDGDAEEDEEEVEVKKDPVMYRWVSNKSGLSFSVPTAMAAVPTSTDSAEPMDVNRPEKEQEEQKGRPNVLCNVEGCEEVRKYRLVRAWEWGACGMDHLKVLEGRVIG